MVVAPRSATDEAGLESAEDGTGAVAHPELEQDVAHVVLHGAFGEVQTVGDLAVGVPRGEQAQDVELALGEGLWRERRIRFGGGVGEGVEQGGRDGRLDEPPSCGDDGCTPVT